MTLRKDLNDLDTNGQKGDWIFVNDDTILILRWGDSVDDIAMMYVSHTPKGNHPVWEWNGNKELPTLSPSILVHGHKGEPARWHGYLTNGKLTTV